MKKFILLVSLIGCGDKPTYRDAFREIGDATCERYLRCGWTTHQVHEECVSESVDYFCSQINCDHPFNQMDKVLACTSSYRNAPCEEVREPCKF